MTAKDANARYQQAVRRDLERLATPPEGHPETIATLCAKLYGSRQRGNAINQIATRPMVRVLPALAFLLGEAFPEAEYREIVDEMPAKAWPDPWLDLVQEVAAWPEWIPLKWRGLMPGVQRRRRARNRIRGMKGPFRQRPRQADTEVAVTVDMGLVAPGQVVLPWQQGIPQTNEPLMQTFRQQGQAALPQTTQSATMLPGLEFPPILEACPVDVIAQDRQFAADYLGRYGVALGFMNRPETILQWYKTTKPTWYLPPEAIGMVRQLAEWTGHPEAQMATMLYTTGFLVSLQIDPNFAEALAIRRPEDLAERGIPNLLRPNLVTKQLPEIMGWQLTQETHRKGWAHLRWAKIGQRAMWRVPQPLSTVVNEIASKLAHTFQGTSGVANLFLSAGLYLFTNRLDPFLSPIPQRPTPHKPVKSLRARSRREKAGR